MSNHPILHILNTIRCNYPIKLSLFIPFYSINYITCKSITLTQLCNIIAFYHIDSISICGYVNLTFLTSLQIQKYGVLYTRALVNASYHLKILNHGHTAIGSSNYCAILSFICTPNLIARHTICFCKINDSAICLLTDYT